MLTSRENNGWSSSSTASLVRRCRSCISRTFRPHARPVPQFTRCGGRSIARPDRCSVRPPQPPSDHRSICRSSTRLPPDLPRRACRRWPPASTTTRPCLAVCWPCRPWALGANGAALARRSSSSRRSDSEYIVGSSRARIRCPRDDSCRPNHEFQNPGAARNGSQCRRKPIAR
jgi:hypothetical protein